MKKKTPKTQNQRGAKKQEQKTYTQLCSSLSLPKGQITRGRPEAAGGSQALTGDVSSGIGPPATGCFWPGFLVHLQGQRSRGPTGHSISLSWRTSQGGFGLGAQRHDRFPEHFLISCGIRFPRLRYCSVHAFPSSLPRFADLYSPLTASLKWVFSEESYTNWTLLSLHVASGPLDVL